MRYPRGPVRKPTGYAGAVSGKLTAGAAVLLVAAACASPEPAVPTAEELSWRALAEAPTPRTEVAAALADGRIYAVGGFAAPNRTVDTVEVYDIGADAWSPGPPLPLAVNHAMAATVDGRIHVLGGFTARGPPTDQAFGGAGFQTQQTDPGWLYKALKEDVLVDVIFLSDGQVILDDEMLRRARSVSVENTRLPAMAAEDLIVIKALVHKERSPRHWFDALALLRRDDIDWDYLLRRARQYGPLRVLSLLYYARSNDQMVPDEAIRRISEVA